MKEKKLNILITGGAQGLGKLISQNFSQKGHHVIIFDIIKYNNIENSYKRLIYDYINMDLSDVENLKKNLNYLINKYNKIDVLINNASLRIFKNFEIFTFQEINKALRVNLEAPLILINSIIPIMKQNNFGRIINISSRSGFWGFSTGSIYCSTKSALIKFTESVGKELERENADVTINVICPGSFSYKNGTKLKNYNTITKKVINIIGDLISSKDNAEVIPVLTKKDKVVEILYSIKQYCMWFFKY
ncbi:MAG: SDR family oxidoreductase [Candidatus Aminicenantes bacterium]|jgi:short-subunit dehydrogenase